MAKEVNLMTEVPDAGSTLERKQSVARKDKERSADDKNLTARVSHLDP